MEAVVGERGIVRGVPTIVTLVRGVFTRVFLNGKKVGEVYSLPTRREDVVLGFLLSNGYVEDPEDITLVIEDDAFVQSEVPLEKRIGSEHPLEGRSIYVNGSLRLSGKDIEKGVEEMFSNRRYSLPLELTGVVNTSTNVYEDILPEASLYRAVAREWKESGNSAVITTYVITPKEVLLLANSGFPVIVSLRGVTEDAVRVAEYTGVTLGVMEDELVVFSHPHRIKE